MQEEETQREREREWLRVVERVDKIEHTNDQRIPHRYDFGIHLVVVLLLRVFSF